MKEVLPCTCWAVPLPVKCRRQRRNMMPVVRMPCGRSWHRRTDRRTMRELTTNHATSEPTQWLFTSLGRPRQDLRVVNVGTEVVTTLFSSKSCSAALRFRPSLASLCASVQLIPGVFSSRKLGGAGERGNRHQFNYSFIY